MSWNGDGGSWSGLEELDWDGEAGLGWRNWTRDGRSSLYLQAPLMLLSVWGPTVVLFLNIGIFHVIFATYLHFKVIHYLKFRRVFKFGISTPLPESLLLSLTLQKTEKREREREARTHQGKIRVRRQRVGGGTGRLHVWGKTWRGAENSGVGKSEARIHNSLRSLSQLLVSAYIKLGTQLGFVLSLGTWSHLGVSGTLCKVHAIASTLPSHRTLGKLRQQVCGPEGYRLTRCTGGLGQQGSPLLQHLGEAGPAFPQKAHW